MIVQLFQSKFTFQMIIVTLCWTDWIIKKQELDGCWTKLSKTFPAICPTLLLPFICPKLYRCPKYCLLPCTPLLKYCASWHMSKFTIATSRGFCSLECASVDMVGVHWSATVEMQRVVYNANCNICGKHYLLIWVYFSSSLHWNIYPLNCVTEQFVTVCRSAVQNDIVHIQV